MNRGISRTEEANIPKFNSHDEARAYFKEKYGDNFMMMDSAIIDGMKLYFYDLILNKEAYILMQEKKRQSPIMLDTSTITEEMFFSSQRIEIFENGNIHILH